MPASEKHTENYSALDKFRVVLETAGLNTTELSSLLHQRGFICRTCGLLATNSAYLTLASVAEALDENANTVLTMAEQGDLEKRHQQDRKEI